MNKFPKIVSSELKYYVYIYSNPTTEEIFYVGKGKGDRVFSHLFDESESEKVKYLSELKLQGIIPKIEILIHGIENEQAALRVESAIIDLIGINKLTNKQSGWKSASFGRMSLKQVVSTYSKQKIDIEESGILIRINQMFRYSMTEMELYDYTRGRWKININRAKKAKYAFAVYDGIIQEVYSVFTWLEAGKIMSTRIEKEISEGRFEFIGDVAEDEIRNKYRYKSVEHYFKKGNANPIMYLNC
jgi:hypothetical protein